MAIGTIGITRPADVSIDDIEIYYNYTPDRYTNNNDIFKISGILLKKSDAGRKKIRLIGISLSNFDSYKDRGQLELL